MNISKKKQCIIAAAVIVLVLAVYGWFMASRHAGHGRTGGGSETEKAALYTCPMHPEYTSPKPGRCPICGMDIVPMKKDDKPQGHGKEVDGRSPVTIDEEKQKMIGVRTATVSKGQASATIRAKASVAYDPELAVAEREYLDAVRTGDKTMASASERRLRLMGQGGSAIEELRKRGSPDDALTLPKDRAWVYATIYERELPLVKEGMTADIQLPDGAQVGMGTIRSIDSVLNEATRSARAKIEVENTRGILKPNMFVNAIVKNDMGERILVPKSAVMDTGKRKLVFVVHGGSHFEPREVQLGPEVADAYVVGSGIAEGDTVAVDALFLIDSESRLKSAAGAASGHKHD